MTYEVKVSRFIDQVDISKWNGLADFCFLKSDMLKIIENLDLGKNSYYVEIYSNGNLAGIAVFYGQYDSTYFTLEESIYGKYLNFVKPFLGLNPSLLCYFPYSPFYEMFKIASGYNKREIFALISKRLEALAIKGGYKSYGFLSVSDMNLVKGNSHSNLISIFSGFKVIIHVLGKNFDEHIENMSKKSHRKTIRKEVKEFEKSDYKFEKLQKLGDYENFVLNIFHQNSLKYCMDMRRTKHIDQFVRALDKSYDKVNFFVGKLKGNVVMALMSIEDEKRVIGIKAGQLDISEEGFPFYNVCVYEPLKHAIVNSKKSLELGTGNYKYKTRRGAELSKSYNMINSTSKFKNLYLYYVIKMLDKRSFKKHVGRLDGRR